MKNNSIYKSASPVYAPFCIGVLTFLVVISLNYLNGFFQNLELSFYDRMLSLRTNPGYNSPVTLITITDDDFTRLQQSHISDGILADVLTKLIAHHPRVIGVDLYRDIPLPPDTDKLKTVIMEHNEIVVARKYGDTASPGIAAPGYLLNQLEQSGCTDIPLDSDNRVRRGLILLGDKEICYSLAYLIAVRYLVNENTNSPGDTVQADSVRLGKTYLPKLFANDGGYQNMDSGGYQVLLDFRYPITLFHRYSLHQAQNNLIPSVDIDGKIILIGTDAESNKDFFAIPDLPQDINSQKIPGIELLGLFVDQLVRVGLYDNQPLKILPDWLENIWALFWCILGIMFGIGKHPLRIFIPALVLGVAAIGIAVYFMFCADVWMPMIPSSVGWLLSCVSTSAWTAHREYKQRIILKNLFSLHVGETVFNEIWQHQNEILDNGQIIPQRMEATVLFSDLKGFTQIAEALEPEIFFFWLNEYLDTMITVICRHNGVVIRFIGDAIMAGFGVPLPGATVESANNAARCALTMQAELECLNRNWALRNLPVVTMRIGINTGYLIAGSLGNRERMEYTIHGDTVNTASRLESYEKESSSTSRILISASTEQHLSPDFCRTSLGSIEVKGKSEPIEAFRLELK